MSHPLPLPPQSNVWCALLCSATASVGCAPRLCTYLHSFILSGEFIYPTQGYCHWYMVDWSVTECLSQVKANFSMALAIVASCHQAWGLTDKRADMPALINLSFIYFDFGFEAFDLWLVLKWLSIIYFGNIVFLFKACKDWIMNLNESCLKWIMFEIERDLVATKYWFWFVSPGLSGQVFVSDDDDLDGEPHGIWNLNLDLVPLLPQCGRVCEHSPQ